MDEMKEFKELQQEIEKTFPFLDRENSKPLVIDISKKLSAVIESYEKRHSEQNKPLSILICDDKEVTLPDNLKEQWVNDIDVSSIKE